MIAFLAAAFAALLFACCGNAQAVHVAVATPKPVPTWPSYAARDYLKTGHPKLNASEKARIRYTLTRIKLCQRRYLRYAFTSARQPWFIMFFGQASRTCSGEIICTTIQRPRVCHLEYRSLRLEYQS